MSGFTFFATTVIPLLPNIQVKAHSLKVHMFACGRLIASKKLPICQQILSATLSPHYHSKLCFACVEKTLALGIILQIKTVFRIQFLNLYFISPSSNIMYHTHEYKISCIASCFFFFFGRFACWACKDRMIFDVGNHVCYNLF